MIYQHGDDRETHNNSASRTPMRRHKHIPRLSRAHLGVS